HQEFVDAYKAGTLNAFIQKDVAGEYLSRRLWLPLVRLPIVGAGVALVLIGWFITGVLIFLVGVLLPRLVKRNAVAMLMYQALHDPDTYEELRQAGVLEVYDE